jgi:trehalose-phosphatase
MSTTLANKRYFFPYWDKLKRKMLTKHIVLFLDFDGTLVKIASTPDKATLPDDTRLILQKLLVTLRCRIAVISGRKLSDLKRKINIPFIIYVGNHGYEIDGSDFDFRNLVSLSMNETLGLLRDQFQKHLSQIPGVLIEDKELTLSVHYRLVESKNLNILKKIFDDICEPYLENNQIMVKPGKMVLEVRPPGIWDKGKAVLWLLNQWKITLGDDNVFPIYIGDDNTDEDAFKVLKDKGLTIKVEPWKETYAEYYLERQEEVNRLLTLLLEVVA